MSAQFNPQRLEPKRTVGKDARAPAAPQAPAAVPAATGVIKIRVPTLFIVYDANMENLDPIH